MEKISPESYTLQLFCSYSFFRLVVMTHYLMLTLFDPLWFPTSPYNVFNKLRNLFSYVNQTFTNSDVNMLNQCTISLRYNFAMETSMTQPLILYPKFYLLTMHDSSGIKYILNMSQFRAFSPSESLQPHPSIIHFTISGGQKLALFIVKMGQPLPYRITTKCNFLINH